ncbi:formylglycine-generating enzyme family protein [Streptomyces brevispora]|uniref:Formylglycine-generating enzyme family protein n=1 Tax=Streptomyces brevispora TaxID=887462 RepID=A0ABZ1GES7_9ACTN|nr:SUMF1/EgtB/PvdO family nonheme iron enzyme [Streptomyces brevispora]WSC11577.1 formylglycine-generating enzyme family protein [Streptomyces brevispora]WSC17534.1 formylglycine-generating enzyme family protein [Streptomyces brevispora]
MVGNRVSQVIDIPADMTVTDDSTDDRYWASVERVVALAGQKGRTADGIPLLASIAVSHPEWPVRAGAVRLLATHHAGDEAAGAAVAAATHDTVDWVAFTALKVITEHRIAAAVPDLIRISGWPSNFTRPDWARKPVGCGAALTKRALIAVFGTKDPVELRRLEDEYFSEMRSRIAAARKRVRRHEDVVLVPAGPAIIGADEQPDAFRMAQDDTTLRAVDVPAFLIDRTTVTNARYREFLQETGESGEFDHPDQPLERSHRPAHWHDPRFNAPDTPVVGIDWYDAYAFAAWAGGTLPSEVQWEKAARGVDGRRFPWGEDWDPERVNDVERSFGQAVADLDSLEALLVTIEQGQNPAHPVLAADALPQGASPYGALQMSGNVWELTRTNFYTGQDMDPFFKGRHPLDFMNRKEAFHVLRGGTFTSPPACLTTFYRGKDLITDRHMEVGFRCVYEADN